MHSDSVEVGYTLGVGIEESLSFKNLNTFPNPGQDQLWVEFEIKAPNDLNVSLLDLTGKVVMKQQLSAGTGTHRLSFETAQLAKGLYMIRVEGNQITEVIKWVKR